MRDGIGIGRAVLLCVVFYLVWIGITTVVTLLETPIAAMLGVQAGAWVVTIGLAQRWSGELVRETFALRRFPVRLLPALVVASLGVTIPLLEIAGWIPLPSFLQELVDAVRRAEPVEPKDPGLVAAALVSVAVIAPLAEEIFFRGQLLGSFLARSSRRRAVWTSAAVFAAFHLNPWQAVVALPLGLAYAGLVLRTGSVLPGMVSHAVVNFTANWLVLPFAALVGIDREQLMEADHYPAAMLAVSCVLAIAGGWVLWRQLGGSGRASRG